VWTAMTVNPIRGPRSVLHKTIRQTPATGR
jgi:hypothetical protein